MAAYYWQRLFVAVGLFVSIFLFHFLMSPGSKEFLDFLLPHDHVIEPPSDWSRFNAVARESTSVAPKHLVIITSMIYGANPTVFSPEQRYQQVIDSIESVKERIPDHFIVVVEGGVKLNESMAGGIRNHGAALWHYDVRGMPKAVGEAQLLYSFLRMPHDFKRFMTISKLSGRFQLTKDFNFNVDFAAPVAKVDVSRGCVETRYYRLPPDANHLLKHALLLMLSPHDSIRDKVKVDKDDTLDEIFFKTKLFEKAVVPKVLGVSGLSALDGKKREL